MKNSNYEKTSSRVIDLIDYILATEEKDFKENPYKEHIYYTALILAVGEEKAEKELNDHLREEKV